MKTASILTAAISLSASQIALADVWAERQALAAIAQELTALERLVNDASQMREDDTRVQFNYDMLMVDLSTIRAGIATHLSQPMNPVMPSHEPGLGGSYTKGNK